MLLTFKSVHTVASLSLRLSSRVRAGLLSLTVVWLPFILVSCSRFSFSREPKKPTVPVSPEACSGLEAFGEFDVYLQVIETFGVLSLLAYRMWGLSVTLLVLFVRVWFSGKTVRGPDTHIAFVHLTQQLPHPIT
jgi:hypothetical protein